MKKKLVIFLMSAIMISSLTSCGEKINADTKTETKIEQKTDENKTVQDGEKEAKDNKDNMWIPKNIIKVYAIDRPNKMIRDLIAKYYDIPEEEYSSTRYYYNYSDLDGDGKKDVFAVVVGPYTSGSGGSSALWLREKDGKYEINQAFTLVNPPIIIEGKENEQKSLIMKRYGGGEKEQTVRLKLKDGKFENVSEAKEAGSLENIHGKAIIANDLSQDIDDKTALTLDK